MLRTDVTMDVSLCRQVEMRLFRRRGSDSAPQLVSLSPLRREEGGDPEDPAAPPLIKPSIIYISADEQHKKGKSRLKGLIWKGWRQH